MKKVILNEIEYEVCTSWDDVTLEKQIQVSIDKDNQETDILKKISILSGYSNIPVQILKRANISDLQEVFKLLSFVNKDIPNNPIDKFEFNGETYYVGQNLMEQEFQDYVSLQNILEKHKDNIHLALPYILSIMSKKLKEDGTLETLDDYDPEKRAEEFKKINILVANNVATFFLTSINVSLNISQLYSKETVQMKINDIKNMLTKQDGQGVSTRLVNGILLKYIKYIERRLDKFFIL